MTGIFEKGLESVNFFTTYRCNSRCTNCFIWKGDDRKDIQPLSDDEISKLFYDDPVISKCREFGFAGGEPTISDFFWRALALVPEGRHITVTTNGLSSSRLIKTLNERKDRENFVVQVSLDGIGHIHDEIRGIKGSYDKSIFLLERLRDIGVPRLISFTINRLNFHQILSVYEIAEALGAEFSARMAYCGGAYRNNNTYESESIQVTDLISESASESLYVPDSGQLNSLDYAINKIIDSELGKKNHSPARTVFLSKITAYCRGIQHDIECGALHTGTVIDLYGYVFPNCPVIMKSLGNIREKSFYDIWHGQQAENLREHVRKFACGGCWNDCQVITNISHNRSFLEKNYSEIRLSPLLEIVNIKESVEMSDHGSESVLGSGWYSPEGESNFIYRWTSGAFSIAVPEDTIAVQFFCVPACSAKNGNNSAEAMTSITAFINSEKAGENVFTSDQWQEIRIGFDRPLGAASICFFELSDSLKPESVAAEALDISGADIRELGMAVKSIKFIKNH
jgi:MoaA/NifB/PqqE/SkfB family radical SAM enzyme